MRLWKMTASLFEVSPNEARRFVGKTRMRSHKQKQKERNRKRNKTARDSRRRNRK